MLRPAAGGQLPGVILVLSCFLAVVRAVTEGICDSPTLDINVYNVYNESNIF